MEFLPIDTIISEGMIKVTSDYHLILDKVWRDIISSQRDNYVGLGCYALNVEDVLQNS